MKTILINGDVFPVSDIQLHFHLFQNQFPPNVLYLEWEWNLPHLICMSHYYPHDLAFRSNSAIFLLSISTCLDTIMSHYQFILIYFQSHNFFIVTFGCLLIASGMQSLYECIVYILIFLDQVLIIIWQNLRPTWG